MEHILTQTMELSWDLEFGFRFESDMQALWVGLEGSKNPAGWDLGGLEIHVPLVEVARLYQAITRQQSVN